MTDQIRLLGFLLCLGAAMLLPACGGGGGGGISGDKTANTLVLIDMSVGNFDGVALNEIIQFEFSEDLDPDTIRPDTIQIRLGPNYGHQVPGNFRTDGNLVYFYPRLPVLPDLSDSGFQPGSDYKITLPGAPAVATVRNFAGDRLPNDEVETFKTAVTGSPNLFIDNFLDPLPPQVLFVNPSDGAEEVPGASTISLTFNRRPLNPGTVTSGNIRLWMESRQGQPINRPVSGAPILTQSYDSVTVTYVPTFPLADEATYRLEVDRRVQDLVGNDVEAFESTFTIRDEPFRFDAFDLTFNELQKLQYADLDVTTASWNEEVADALAALFTAAGGDGTAGDLIPTSNQNLTPDDFDRGAGIMLDGDDGHYYYIYQFRVVTIPEGRTVRFSVPKGGPNLPVKVQALKPIEVYGTITVAGGQGVNGYQTSTTSTTIKAGAGGDGGPGGGAGASRYTGTKSPRPIQDGEDVVFEGETYARGGEGGTAPDSTYYKIAGGGGGGGGRLDGKDGKRGGYNQVAWRGDGGPGGPGEGFGNLQRKPNVGGAGGGCGGEGGHGGYNWRNGGGTGGGGGGAICVQSAGNVTIGSKGAILANAGGGGDTTPYAYYGGAGGGGGGGSVLIRATGKIVFQPAATLDVAGGSGGAYSYTSTYYNGGQGGDGGTGFLRLEAMREEPLDTPIIEGITSANLTYAPSQGVYEPKGKGANSVGLTLWVNLGVFDPVMIKPTQSDVIGETFLNQFWKIEVQMAVEDANNLGLPDLNTASPWVTFSSIADLNNNGYQFIRVRVTFTLDDEQTVETPLPYIDNIRIPFKF